MATAPGKTALRQHRRDRKLCIHCGALAKTGQTRCQSCVDRDKELRKQWRVRDIERKICANTGCSNKTADGKHYCDSCNEKSASRTSRRRSNRVADGLCSQCGEQPRFGDWTRCRKCHERMLRGYDALVARRIKAGVCDRCGEQAPLPGYIRCERCLAAASVRHAALKQEICEAYGGVICVGCGETEIGVLQLDHIDGGGKAHALDIGGGDLNRGRAMMYRWVRDNGFPPGFRILCANCNIRAKRGLPFPNPIKPRKRTQPCT